MKVFLTSTLHHPLNLALNPRIASMLEARGFSVYLPQRDTDQSSDKTKIAQNLNAIRASDASLVIIDHGTHNLAAEAGFAKGLGHMTIGVVTKGTDVPIMLRGVLDHLLEVESLSDVPAYMDTVMRHLSTPRTNGSG